MDSKIHLTDQQWAFIRPLFPPRRRPTTWRAKIGRPLAARKEDYRLRYTVERSFAWLGAFRRLLIRWEHLATVYEAFFCVALLRICFRRL